MIFSSVPTSGFGNKERKKVQITVPSLGTFSRHFPNLVAYTGMKFRLEGSSRLAILSLGQMQIRNMRNNRMYYTRIVNSGCRSVSLNSYVEITRVLCFLASEPHLMRTILILISKQCKTPHVAKSRGCCGTVDKRHHILWDKVFVFNPLCPSIGLLTVKGFTLSDGIHCTTQTSRLGNMGRFERLWSKNLNPAHKRLRSIRGSRNFSLTIIARFPFCQWPCLHSYWSFFIQFLALNQIAECSWSLKSSKNNLRRKLGA